MQPMRAQLTYTHTTQTEYLKMALFRRYPRLLLPVDVLVCPEEGHVSARSRPSDGLVNRQKRLLQVFTTR